MTSGEGSAAEVHAKERLGTPTDPGLEATRDISAALRGLLADVLALYLKVKNFHGHMSCLHFRDHHMLLDEHGEQIFAMTNPIAERARGIGGTTMRSIGEIAHKQRIAHDDARYVEPQSMLVELRDDNQRLVSIIREAHGVCEAFKDVATTSRLEVWIDEAECRTWLLYGLTRHASGTNG